MRQDLRSSRTPETQAAPLTINTETTPKASAPPEKIRAPMGSRMWMSHNHAVDQRALPEYTAIANNPKHNIPVEEVAIPERLGLIFIQTFDCVNEIGRRTMAVTAKPG